MYYLVKGICHDDLEGSFEWVINADSKETVLAELDETYEVIEVREISVGERIEREEETKKPASFAEKDSTNQHLRRQKYVLKNA